MENEDLIHCGRGSCVNLVLADYQKVTEHRSTAVRSRARRRVVPFMIPAVIGGHAFRMHFAVCVQMAAGENVLLEMPKGRDRSRVLHESTDSTPRLPDNNRFQMIISQSRR